jgi:uncharacterized membrane protein YdbT with pleckstrin-like domain
MLVAAEERIVLEARRHGIVLLRPLAKAALVAAVGIAAARAGWPLTLVGAALLAIAALVAVAAVWRWDRTHVVLTTEMLFVVHGTVRRRAAAVRLERVGPIEVEQSLLGRLLGYGTLVAGDLEITHVPRPSRLIERLSA